jgi:hypothetical protein
VADLWELADLTTPWCIHTVATLRIADHLDAGVTAIDELAVAAACDQRALHCVLGHLVSKGVFEEPEPGRFALNDTSRQLLGGAFLSLDGIGGRFAHAWNTLPAYVQTGRAAYAERFGRPFWDDLAAHPQLAAEFDALIGPAGHGAPNPDLQLRDGWDAITSVVDVGGGTGSMLTELLRVRPNLKATLVDLPGTVARAVDGPYERVGQSFFEPLPAGADLYLLRSVLNDWPDEETDAILRRCAEATHAASRVVISGGVAPDDAPRRLEIEMVLLGGRTDTLAAFRERAARAGLEVIAAGPQPAGRFVVECRRS